MADAPEHTKPDYRSTVFLPKTDFPMKAGLPQKEPAILARWEAEGLYEQLRKARAGREQVHPPRRPALRQWRHAHRPCDQQHPQGHRRPHPDPARQGRALRARLGLPRPADRVEGRGAISQEEARQGRGPGRREFRAECRAYAEHWVDVQREQFKRLGISGDWDDPYLTMKYEAEATIVEELLKFAESGQLYRGAKPVMWSPVEKTALAEAEVEYEDIVSTQIDVAFEIVESPIPELVGAHAVIWTTTPWTIPVNQAIAYGPDVEYVVCYWMAGTADSRRWSPETCCVSQAGIC